MTDLRSGFTNSLMLRELKNIHEALTKTKEEHTLNFRVIKPTEKFNFSEPILNTSKLELIRLSVYNSVFNVNRKNNQFLYASTVIEDDETLPRALSSDPNLNPISTSSPNITSILNYNYKGFPLLYSTITPGAYELTDIAELIKEETYGNIIIEPDKNTMKCLMEIKEGALSFDIENSLASLLGFRKIIYKKGRYKSQKIIDIMGFSNINIHCNVRSGVKDNGKDTDILYTFNLTEPPGYLINIIPTNPPIDEKDVVNKEYCDNNLLSSSNKIDILIRNITELRKGEFDKVTTKTLELNEIQVNENLIKEFIKTANEVTNTVNFCNKVAADTISKYNQLKQEFDNNKFNQNITNIQLDEMFTNGLRELKEYNKSLRGVIVQYIISILLRSKLLDNKEQDRLEMHYGFKQEDITKEIESFLLMKMSRPTAPSESLLYPDLSSVSERLMREAAAVNEQQINEKIQANNKFNNNINIIKDIRSYYETETNNYNRKLSRYKNYINVAEITEILLPSIATTATTTSVALRGIGLPYSIPTAFATATVCGSLSKTINTKIRNNIIKYSQMYILSKQFSDKFNKLYTKSMNDNKIDNDEYNEFVKLYEDYKKNRRSRNSVDKKNKLSIFLD